MRNIIDTIKDPDIIDYLEYLKYERRVSLNTIVLMEKTYFF